MKKGGKKMNNFVKALKKAVSIISRNVPYPVLGTVLLQGDGKSLKGARGGN